MKGNGLEIHATESKYQGKRAGLNFGGCQTVQDMAILSKKQKLRKTNILTV